jgi:hypothetical protein
MEYQIKLYLLILTIIYICRFLFQLVMKLRDDNPEPLTINKTDKILLYFVSAYIITYFLI